MKTTKVAVQEKQRTNLIVLQDYLIADKEIQDILKKADEYLLNPDRKTIDRINELRHINYEETNPAVEVAEQIKKLQKFGFRWFVTDKIAERFPYIAELYSNDLLVYESKMGNRWYLQYNGFVPNSILDKIEALRTSNIYTSGVTIHSINPLPVVKIMSRTEPVAIGWLDSIYFRWFSKQQQVKKDWPRQETIIGIVLGIWGDEKEYDIFAEEETNDQK